jgi:hypothetical protein
MLQARAQEYASAARRISLSRIYERMRKRGWSRTRLAKELGVPENSVRWLLGLRDSSRMGIVDAALAKMNAELPIGLASTRTPDPCARPAQSAMACDNLLYNTLYWSHDAPPPRSPHLQRAVRCQCL